MSKATCSYIFRQGNRKGEKCVTKVKGDAQKCALHSKAKSLQSTRVGVCTLPVDATVGATNNLAMACQKGDLVRAKYLVEKGADVQAFGNSAIRFASKHGHLAVVKYLVENGADVQALDNLVIKEAAAGGHLEVVKYLVGKGADFRADNDPVRQASFFGHVKVVKYLVEMGADFKSKNNFAVKWASARGHFEVVWYLVTMGAPISFVVNEQAREYLVKRNKEWSRSTHSDFSKKTHDLFSNLLLGIQRLEDQGYLLLADQAMIEEMLGGWTWGDDMTA